MKRTALLPALVVLTIYLAFQIPLISSVTIAQYDESIYMDVARNVGRTGLPIRSQGEGKQLDQTPLYPYLLGVFSLLFNENLLILRLITVAFGAASVLLCYAIGRKLGSIHSGIISALLLSLNPFFGRYSYFIRMEIFLCFFLLLATYFLVKREDDKKLAFLIVASLAIAFAVLIKFVAVTFWAAAMLYVIIKACDRQQRVSDFLWLAFPTAIAILCWLLFSLLEPGQFEARLTRWQTSLLGGGSIVDPRLGVTLHAWFRTIGELVLGWETVLLFALALVTYPLVAKKRPRLVSFLLLYISITLTVSVVTQLKEARHVIGLIPMTALAIGLIFDWRALIDRISASLPLLVGTTFLALAFAWGLSPLTLPIFSDWREAENRWERLYADRIFHNDTSLSPLMEIGEYLKAHSLKGAKVVVVRQGPVVGYYADRSYDILYTRPFVENMALLEENDLFVVDRMEFWQQTPEETEKLLQYVEDHFAVEYVVSNVVLYRKAR